MIIISLHVGVWDAGVRDRGAQANPCAQQSDLGKRLGKGGRDPERKGQAAHDQTVGQCSWLIKSKAPCNCDFISLHAGMRDAG